MKIPITPQMREFNDAIALIDFLSDNTLALTGGKATALSEILLFMTQLDAATLRYKVFCKAYQALMANWHDGETRQNLPGSAAQLSCQKAGSEANIPSKNLS